LVSVALLLSITGGAWAADKLNVFVSILPQKHFVQRIGGDRVDVSVMVLPGANPATYEPKPKQMVELSRAGIYFAVGVPFESAWLPKIASAGDGLWVVHTEAGIDKVPMKIRHNGQGAGRHGGEKEKPVREETEHTRRGVLDPHVWLSPPLVLLQARNIVNALEQVDPEGREVYADNFKRFVAEVAELDNELRSLFARASGGSEEFMVFHPAWGYFARAYGLEQVPIELEGKDPKPAELQGIIEYARRRGIGVIFAQPQFSADSAELVADEIGGEVVFVDPLAENWAENLRKAGRKFESALR
jgi:zinc transport system substrate-binding protein